MSTATPLPPSSSPAWMSWWDRYLAPGDLRHRQQNTTTPPPPATTAGDLNNGTPNPIAQNASATTTPASPRMTPSHRRRRQNALFLGGLTFTLLSLTLTRRTIRRKRLAAYPSTFTPSHMHISPPPNAEQQVSKVEGSLMAIEALGLATLNVCSIFMAGVGGAMVWWDLAQVEDLRRKVELDARGLGEEDEVEREVEGWIAGAFGQGSGGQQKDAVGQGAALLAGQEVLRQGVISELDRVRKEKGEPTEGGE